MSLTAQAASTELTAETTTWENSDYVVPAGVLTISGHITVKGTVNLTLPAGTTLTANAGITLSDDATLNVSGEGAMTVNGTNNSTASTVAGNGTLVLTSGTLTAKGGNGQGIEDRQWEQTGANGGTAINGSVIMNGGTLTATGGNGGSVGGSCYNCKGGNGDAAISGNLTVNGGTMTATNGTAGSLGSRPINSSAGAAGASIGGTLTLGKNVTLYDGLYNVLDDNNSSSREYNDDRTQIMHAVYEVTYAVTQITHTPAAAEGTVSMTYGDSSTLLPGETSLDDVKGKTVTLNITPGSGYRVKSVTVEKPAEATITLDNTTTGWRDGTYAVPAGGLTYSEAITVSGDVTLVLTDGETLTLNKGIGIAEGATLTIQGEGAMNINGTNSSTASTVAGCTGMLVLTGGTLTAKGGDGQGFSSSGDNRNGAVGGVAINGNVTVEGGTLTATGGNGGSIGSDAGPDNRGGNGGVAISGSLTINGGTVTTTNGSNGTSSTQSWENSSAGSGGKAVAGTVTDNTGTNTETGGAGNESNPEETATIIEAEKQTDGSWQFTMPDYSVTLNIKYEEGADKTALNDAITAAKKLYDSIKDNDDYTDIVNTLKTAIDAAKGVAGSGTADQNDINAATTAITTAKTTAETAKKNIDDTKAAKAVIEKINALPLAGDVTASDKAAIEEAREAYDKLTDDQKEIVNKDASILLYLQAAEEALAALPEILDSTSITWTKNATITDNLTIYDKVTVTADITLTIPEGKTLTVNGGIDAGEYTVTVAGKGMLVVTGTNGTEGTNGTSNGGAGSDGFKGNIIVDGATVTVTGGNGGNVTGSYDISGSNGGNGGNGVAGNITVNSGSATVTGGNGGTGGKGRIPGSSGSTGIAVTGTITGTTVEESADNSTWTKIESGASSTKKYIKVTEATAEVVKSKIDALPNADEVTIEDKTDIQKARDAYDALDGTEKDKIDEDTLKKLTDAEDALAAAEASNMINALPSAADITTANKGAVEAVRKAYDDLTDAQEAYVSVDTLKKLTDAEDALAAAEASNMINALPSAADITIANKEAVEAARKAYDDLTDAQEAYVSADTLKKLTDAEAMLKDLTDTAVAENVTDIINKLPASDKVATADKAAIEAARKAYDALTADQKKKVPADVLKKLTDAETALKAAEKDAADKTAADKVTKSVNALPASDKVATTDKAAIEAARKAYDALTADQKKKVSADTLKKLTEAETALKAAEKKAAEDKAAAEKKAAEEKVARELAAAKEEAQAAMNEQVTVTQKGNKFTVKWTKASSADGYYVYAQYCGKKVTKPVKTITKNTTTKTTISKIGGKKINQKKQFKVYVAPYKIIDGKKVTLGKSTVAHLVGSKNAKYSNVKKLTLTKSKYTVKVGKTKKIKAKVTLVNKNKKHIPKGHGAKFRYKSSDTSIATVDKNGKIKGIKKGTCTIYVYSINGLTKKAKVTVK